MYLCRLTAVAVLFAALPGVAQEKPKAKPPNIKLKGYTTMALEGFVMFVSDESKTHFEDAKFERKPLEVLELELKGIARVMPPKMLKILQTVKVFVEWEDPESKPKDGGSGVVVARYWYDSGRGLGMAMGGRDPNKANNIEILNMRHLTEKWQPGKSSEQIILLHELCHAVHSHLVGNKNPIVVAAHQQAMDRQLYDNVKHESGRSARAYAATNDHEYFAELSCAYLDRCAWYPFTREQLKDHDAIGYKLMEQVWGKTDPRKTKTVSKPAEKPKTETKPSTKPAAPAKTGAEVEAEAARRLELIDLLVQSGAKDKARAKLQELIDAYPGTEAAKKAKKVLDELK